MSTPTGPMVLVIEDGHEYTTNLERFLGGDFVFERAGEGATALERLSAGGVDVVFLDMKFDRAPLLLGDEAALVRRFAGDAKRARRFLEDNQGTYVLAAVREAGFVQPAIFSYDFDGEPRRFGNLLSRYGPLSYLTDSAGPREIRAALRAALAGSAG